MRELRTCDFCAGDAVGTFAIVPPELEPTEAEQRRVVCCSECKDRLEDLLEPLLVRAGANGANRAATADETGDESGTAVASADDSTRKRPRTSTANAPGSESESVETDSRDGSALEGGITFARSETAASDGSSEEPNRDGTSETAAEGGASESADAENSSGVADADGPNGATGADDSSDGTGDGATGQNVANRPPTGYGKVIRLLQNREFPMRRSAVENLAAGAYDLESREVDAIIDHALEKDEFVENRDELQRP